MHVSQVHSVASKAMHMHASMADYHFQYIVSK